MQECVQGAGHRAHGWVRGTGERELMQGAGHTGGCRAQGTWLGAGHGVQEHVQGAECRVHGLLQDAGHTTGCRYGAQERVQGAGRKAHGWVQGAGHCWGTPAPSRGAVMAPAP